VKRGGDAVRKHLPVGFGKGERVGEVHAGARLHDRLEPVAMQVDDPRQHPCAAGIETACLRCRCLGNLTSGKVQSPLGQSSACQHLSAGDRPILGHSSLCSGRHETVNGTPYDP